MKTLTLFRHGKSDWSQLCSDRLRPINQRGIKSTNLMAERLKQANAIPELIISSSALRAVETATILAIRWGLQQRQELDSLYASDMTSWLAVIASLSNQIDHVLIVGHNPEITEVANFFSSFYIENLATSAYLRCHFNISTWTEVTPNKRICCEYDFPKNNQPIIVNKCD